MKALARDAVKAPEMALRLVPEGLNASDVVPVTLDISLYESDLWRPRTTYGDRGFGFQGVAAGRAAFA